MAVAKWDGATPPDYVALYAWRAQRINDFYDDPELCIGALEYYRTRPVEFITDWCDTYDPRNVGTERPTWMPMVPFPLQVDLIRFLQACLKCEANGLVEKARDMGATWIACGFSVWLWRFQPGAAVGWGSLKQDDVDDLGNASSIFEKMRLLIRRLPPMFWPVGFDPDKHMLHMRIVNPETGAIITGACGDNIGRGGRTLIYFKDESAHYLRPEKIEAALGDNTRVQIDISSVGPLGNVFHRRREAGQDWDGKRTTKTATNIFVMDWRGNPMKDQAWYDARRAKAKGEGLLHVHAREIDRNYAASVENVIIDPEWVASAIDAHEKLGFEASGVWSAALDVADGGLDKNALSARKGVVLKQCTAWGERDTGVTARRAIKMVEGLGLVIVQYDCIGVGAGVKAETNRLKDDKKLPKGVRFVPWDASAAPLWPNKPIIKGDRDAPLNKDFFANLKAQGWHHLARRFERTHKAVTEGVKYDPADLISISSDIPELGELTKELSQATRGFTGNMKELVNKAPPGTRSPNRADSVMMNYHPASTSTFTLDNL